MENPNPQQDNYYDEIDLRGLINVLLDGKWIIVFLVILGAAIALFEVNSRPKLYQAQMLIEVGTIGTGVPVESIATIKDRINQGIYTKLAEKESAVSYPVTAAGTADSNFISLSAVAPDPQAATVFLTKVGDLVIAGHNKKTAAYRISIEERIADVGSNIEEIKKDSRFDCQAEKYKAINDLEELYASLEMAPAQITDTSIVNAAAASDTPLRPNAKIKLIFGATLGLIAGVALVFFRYWWKKSR